MKRDWSLKPNLVDCILEQRIAPAIANLGVIVLTTSGFTLTTPFPGASNSASSTSVATSAQSVSGAAVPTSFYVTGNRGISSFAPGNFTGNPNVATGAATGSVGGVGMSIQIGSGADEAGGSGSTAAASSRNNPGGGTIAPIMAYIGSTSTGSGTPVLPAGQTYMPPTPPVPALAPLGVVIPGSPTGSTPNSAAPSSPFNPQAGAPMFTPGSTSGMTSPLPGGLGVGGGLLQPGSNNH
ncbi:MAG: hypothetical protein ACLQGP_07760 [Isosphaeraceae bacterium]